MNTNFQVSVKKSKGNMYLHTKGDFNGSSACELVNLLNDQYDGDDRFLLIPISYAKYALSDAVRFSAGLICTGFRQIGFF